MIVEQEWHKKQKLCHFYPTSTITHFSFNVRHVKWRVRLGPYCVELRHRTLMWTLSLRSLATVRLHGSLGQNSFPQPVDTILFESQKALGSTENPYITMTETRFYEPARLSTPPKPQFSLKLLDATTCLRSLLSKVFWLRMANSNRTRNNLFHYLSSSLLYFLYII